MQGLLVRVGIDRSYGGWNAPADEQTRRFMFVPIPDCPYNPSNEYVEGGRRTYREVMPVLQKFNAECKYPPCSTFILPNKLHNASTHLDPDFANLTYGDLAPRARRLVNFQRNDFVVFYSSLKSVQTGKLIYALIGLIVLESAPVTTAEIPDSGRLLNAHTRWKTRDSTDVVIRGQQGRSGLFRHYIEIGERRGKGNQYRVVMDLLQAWGGLTVEDGWIQRSATPPAFLQPERFWDWLQDQRYEVFSAQYQA